MLTFSNTHLAKTKTTSPADNAIMTVEEVANYLKVTEQTFYRLAGGANSRFQGGRELALFEKRCRLWDSRAIIDGHQSTA